MMMCRFRVSLGLLSCAQISDPHMIATQYTLICESMNKPVNKLQVISFYSITLHIVGTYMSKVVHRFFF